MIGLQRAATRLAAVSAFVLLLFSASSILAQALATANQARALAVAPPHVEAAISASARQQALRRCGESFFQHLFSPAEGQQSGSCPGTGTLKERRISAPGFTVRDWSPDMALPQAWPIGRLEMAADAPPVSRRTVVRPRRELPWSRSPPARRRP